MSKLPYDTLISLRSFCGEFQVIQEKTQEEFVYKVFMASILLLASPGNYRPSERVAWTAWSTIKHSSEF